MFENIDGIDVSITLFGIAIGFILGACIKVIIPFASDVMEILKKIEIKINALHSELGVMIMEAKEIKRLLEKMDYRFKSRRERREKEIQD